MINNIPVGENCVVCNALLTKRERAILYCSDFAQTWCEKCVLAKDDETGRGRENVVMYRSAERLAVWIRPEDNYHYNIWLNRNYNQLPLEKMILIRHAHGIEAIQFSNAAWRYLYTGNVVEQSVIDSTTEFMIPI